MPPRVVLVGLPGTGKSTVGARLAGRLGVEFADSDQLIEQAEGRTVPQLFAAVGEAGFRQLESATVLAALGGFGGVLALGGGAVTTEAVRDGLRSAAVPVLLLTAPAAELLQRLDRAEDRPLLAGDPAGRLAELTAARAGLYAEVAGARVDTAGATVGQVVERALALLVAENAPEEAR
ncbi:MAG TPA: shikimate kinase [Jatrophihabitans sp.]|nr:shikimate kinase [Jatrophihabitans sp.]